MRLAASSGQTPTKKMKMPILKVAYPPTVPVATGSAFHANCAASATRAARACGVLIRVATLAIGEMMTRPMPMPQPRIAIL